MGAKGSKRDNLDPLTKEESNAINKLMNYKECISIEDLLEKWSSYLTHNMKSHVKHLFSNKPCRQQIVHIYRCLSSSNIYPESYQKLIENVISKSSAQSYLADLIETIILCLKDTDEYAYWIRIGAKAHATLQLSTQLSKEGESDDINKWLQNNDFLGILHKALISTLYGVQNKIDILPPIDIHQKYIQSFKTILDLGWIMFLKNNLPSDCQNHWRLLFSSTSHGESFQALSTSIIDQGSTIIVVRDNSGNVFGGFASEPWLLKPKFFGNSSCFLFSLHPNLNINTSSGHNENYMYMNNGQYTLPNGIGMGGQMAYWGLWIDSEYGQGECSVSCSTYNNYSMLSAAKEFKIDSLEVWCVKEKPLDDSDDDEERQLPSSRDDWDMKLLEMAGRTKYSDGLREEDENQ